jgi:hypothetical protein
MNRRLVQLMPLLCLLLLALMACRAERGLADVRHAYLSGGQAGTPVHVFAPHDSFYCHVELDREAPPSSVRAVWRATNAAGLAPFTTLHVDRVMPRGDSLLLVLPNEGAWPAGKYRLDLYVGNRLDRSFVFGVQ